MKKYLFLLFQTLLFVSCGNNQEKILIYVGSASQPATNEIIELFENETGIKVEVIYGGSGHVLSQMIISKKGDVFFPGSSDYMNIAKDKGVVIKNSEKRVCYLVSAINVQKGNPKNIYTLKDLLRNDLKVAIANPDGVCVGAYAVEIIENSFSEKEQKLFFDNLINYTGSCSKTATAISLKTTDAVIGWRVFQYWDNTNIQTVDLDKTEIVRIAYMPIAVSKFTKNKENSEKFINFVISEKGKKKFEKYNYFTTPKQAFEYIGEEKEIGK